MTLGCWVFQKSIFGSLPFFDPSGKNQRPRRWQRSGERPLQLGHPPFRTTALRPANYGNDDIVLTDNLPTTDATFGSPFAAELCHHYANCPRFVRGLIPSRYKLRQVGWR